MITLLIIADDFTGALDTGVQFAACGANTRVVTRVNYDFGQVDPEVQVLVMDAETRHLSAQEAYDVVHDITRRATEKKIPYLYKKTDSALRGNIGSELTAMLEASGKKALFFLPAFPKMNRQTKGGYHFIDGLPVSESVFGKDPFEPVTCSYIPEMIELQSKVKISVRAVDESRAEDGPVGVANQEGPELLILDAETDGQLEAWGEYLSKSNQLSLTAGCAGFAAVLPELLGITGGERADVKLPPRFLVLCGSVNPITAAQLDYAQENGFMRIRLEPQERLKQEFWTSAEGLERLAQLKEVSREHACVIFDSNDLPGQDETKDYAEAHRLSLEDIRVRIAGSFGHILKFLLEDGLESTLMITGGDTLLGCMEQLGVREITPVCELAPGTVLSQFILNGKKHQVISKSGGFGQETLLVDLAEQLGGIEKEKIENIL